MKWHYRILGSGGLIVHSSLTRVGFAGFENYDIADKVAREVAANNRVCKNHGCIIEVFTRVKTK